MTRLLLRSGKGPFTPVGAETTLAQDIFASNSGNYLFQHSVWRSLRTPGTEIVSNGLLSERRRPQAGDLELINSEFDAFVIPLANAFRPSFSRRLDLLSELIEGLTIPVIVVGVGAQSTTSYDTAALGEVDDSTRRFVSAVLDRSASIGVRGEFTHDYLVGLGLPSDSVDVIGCPSLFLHGPDLRIDKKAGALNTESPVVVNLSPGAARHGAGPWVTAQTEAYRHAVYVLQNREDLALLLWGTPSSGAFDPAVPDHRDHRLYREDRMRLFLDMWPWIDFLAQQEFVVGTRFHGTVAGLLARTPSYLLAHDSRTLELAKHHAIPHRLGNSVDRSWDIAQLHEEADFSAFNAAMPARFAAYTDFLERNGLAHVWQDGNADDEFFDEVARTQFPRPVHTLADPREIESRLRWLSEAIEYDGDRHPQAYEYEFAHPPRVYGASKREIRLQRRLQRQADRIEALEERLAALEAATRPSRRR